MSVSKTADLDTTVRQSASTVQAATELFARWASYPDSAIIAGFTPRPNHIYTQVRAISARINQNYDGFPSDELRKSYATFLGKPVFVNHANHDPTRARGRVVAARYVENGSDKYIDVIQEVNAAKFPKLSRELLDGGLDAVSMGCEAARTICSFCGNEATGIFDMCSHVLNSKGKTLRRRAKHGMEDVLVFEECYDLGFFELSYVFDPADETAVVSNVLTANKKVAWPHSYDNPRAYDYRLVGYGGEDTDVCNICGEKIYGDLGDDNPKAAWLDENGEEGDDTHDHWPQTFAFRDGSRKQAELRPGDAGDRVYCDLPNCARWCLWGGEAHSAEWVSVPGDERSYDFCCKAHRYTHERRFPRWSTEGFVRNQLKLNALREVLGYGEVVAPPPIDTLHPDENADDSDDFHRYVDPPPELSMPDLDRAGEIDRLDDTPEGFEEFDLMGDDEEPEEEFKGFENFDENKILELGEEDEEPELGPDGEPLPGQEDKFDEDGNPLPPEEGEEGELPGVPPGADRPELEGEQPESNPFAKPGEPTEQKVPGGREPGPQVGEKPAEEKAGPFEKAEPGAKTGPEKPKVPEAPEAPKGEGVEEVDKEKAGTPPEEHKLPSEHLDEQKPLAKPAEDKKTPDDSVAVAPALDDDDLDALVQWLGTDDIGENDVDELIRWLAEEDHSPRDESRDKKQVASRATTRKGSRMSGSLADRGRVASRDRVRHQADQSRNDQGEQEETFLTQTPPAEPVETGEGEDITNTEDNLVAKKRRARAELLRRARQRKQAEEKTPDKVDPPLSGTDEQDLKGDFESADPNEGVQETQPKDAARRRQEAYRRRYAHFAKFVTAHYGKAPHEARSIGELRRWASRYARAQQMDIADLYPMLSGQIAAMRKRAEDDEDEGTSGKESEPPDFIKDKIEGDGDEDDRDDESGEDEDKKESRRKRAGEVPPEFEEHQFTKEDGGEKESSRQLALRRRAEQQRRKTADDKLDVAAPDGRVDVEAPTADDTDDEAQASQFDTGDFGNNAGDDVADPDLSTKQNFPPGEGKQSSRVKCASGMQAVRLAEAVVTAGLDENNEGRWSLASRYEKMAAAVVADRTALLERIIAVHGLDAPRKTAGNRGPSRSAVPANLGRRTATVPQQRVAANGSAGNPDSDLFFR